MFQKDFILKMIEQIFQLLAHIMGLKKGGQYEEALEMTNDALAKYFDIEPAFFAELSEEELHNKLLSDNSLNMEQWRAIAYLLSEKADLEILIGDADKGYAIRSKALFILLHLVSMPQGTVSLALFYKIEDLMHGLEGYAPAFITQVKMFDYCERQRLLAKAEDILFELLEQAVEKQAIADAGIQFYESILQLPDDVLEAGHLPRAEAMYGLKEWKIKTGLR